MNKHWNKHWNKHCHCPKCNTPYVKRFNELMPSLVSMDNRKVYDYCTKCKQFDYEIEHELRQNAEEDSIYKKAAIALKGGIRDHDAFSISEVLGYILGEPKEEVIEKIRKAS